MNDQQYEYLDSERKMLWAELRSPQSKLETFIATLSGDSDAIQTGIRSLGIKTARAYNRILDRDSTLDALSRNITSRMEVVENAEKEAATLNASLAEANEKVAGALSKMNGGLSRFDEDLGSLTKRSESLNERLEIAEEYVKNAEGVKSELQSV